MVSDKIIIERADKVVRIVMNKPDSMNSMDPDFLDEMRQVIDEGAQDRGIGAFIITGAGRGFSAGGDIKDMKKYIDMKNPVEYFRLITYPLGGLISAIARAPQPVIAEVNGAASGAGFSLVLACDLAIASSASKFNMAYIRIGLSPDGAPSYTLARAIGYKKAFEALITGEMISAEEALSRGILNRVVNPEELQGAAMELARRLASGPWEAAMRIKKLLRENLSDLERALESERQEIMGASKTEEFRVRLEEFLQRKKK
jgi:2-(1,2-epoxy-1,2-dihydrophenyl)acetyl-CoA isomerase